jgi:hypothetical protein
MDSGIGNYWTVYQSIYMKSILPSMATNLFSIGVFIKRCSNRTPLHYRAPGPKKWGKTLYMIFSVAKISHAYCSPSQANNDLNFSVTFALSSSWRPFPHILFHLSACGAKWDRRFGWTLTFRLFILPRPCIMHIVLPDVSVYRHLSIPWSRCSFISNDKQTNSTW